MRLPNPMCILKTVTLSLRTLLKTGIPMDGCRYVEEQVRHGCSVQILRCERCGKYSVSWSPTPTDFRGGIDR